MDAIVCAALCSLKAEHQKKMLTECRNMGLKSILLLNYFTSSLNSINEDEHDTQRSF
jgi:hypothetical protein